MKLYKIALVNIIIILINSVNGQNNQSRHHRATLYNRTTHNNSQNSHNNNNNAFMEKLTNLVNLDEKQLKRLESLEQRMVRIEDISQDRLEAIRSELNQMKSHTQNLDWLATKADGNLDKITGEFEQLRQDLNLRKVRQPQVSTATSGPNISSSDEPNLSSMLEALSTLLLSTREGVYSIEQTLNILGTNVSNILHYSRDIHQKQQALPTKQLLNSILHSVKSQNTPIYALMNSRGNGFDAFDNNAPTAIPVSCAHLNQLSVKSGIQRIRVSPLTGPFYVMCDMETQDGGWTVIQNRKNGLINFNRNWLEYKFGFGNIAGEFWIGLDKLHEMTASILHELLIVLEDFRGDTRYAKYNAFAVGGEKEDYALNLLGGYDGDAGDSLSYSASYKFSTFDNDNDGWVEGNCAQAHTGAWWYNACETSNLNGQYFAGPVPDSHRFQGAYWKDFHGANYSLKSIKMMIRPVDRAFIPDLS